MAIIIAALQIGGGLYITNVLGRPAEFMQISAIRAWHAGAIVPLLFHHVSQPGHIAHNPQTQAAMDEILRKVQHIDFAIAAVNSAIVLVGLGLALYRRRT